MSTIRLHMCIDVRGVLGWKDKDLVKLFTHNGKRPKANDVRAWLYDKLLEGWEVIPMNPENTCTGFDMKTGCPGHPHEETIRNMDNA